MTQTEVAMMLPVLERLNGRVVSLNEARTRKIEALVKPIEAGLMERMRRMHVLIFQKGTWTEKIFFLIWFGIFCFLEALPVLSKIVLGDRIRECQKIQDADQTNSINKIAAMAINDWTVMESEMQVETGQRLAEVLSESMLATVEHSKDASLKRLDVLKEFLEELDQISNTLKDLFPEYYLDYVKPEIDRAREEFARNLKFN